VQLTQDQSVEDPDQGSENPSQLQKEKKEKTNLTFYVANVKVREMVLVMSIHSMHEAALFKPDHSKIYRCLMKTTFTTTIQTKKR